MSNEIAYQGQMKLLNGTLTDSYSVSGLKASQATELLVRNVQVVPTTAGGTVLDLGGVVPAEAGWAMFTNLDATNYVQVGIQVAGNFYSFLTILAGEQSGPIRLGSLTIPLAVPPIPTVAAPTLYALANTASVSLFYVVYNA